MKSTLRVGIIGGGLMGREAASAFARWFVLNNFPVQVELVAVCDLQPSLLDWFRQIPTVKLLTQDHRQLLASPEVDVVLCGRPSQPA
jgi:predicted dehydrogenase